MESAACLAADPELWASPKKRDRTVAIGICGTCPVLTDCAAYVAASPDLVGVWGGVWYPTMRNTRRSGDCIFCGETYGVAAMYGHYRAAHNDWEHTYSPAAANGDRSLCRVCGRRRASSCHTIEAGQHWHRPPGGRSSVCAICGHKPGHPTHEMRDR